MRQMKSFRQFNVNNISQGLHQKYWITQSAEIAR
jgi:hypothetical protein